jgi:hypothetical protein
MCCSYACTSVLQALLCVCPGIVLLYAWRASGVSSASASHTHTHSSASASQTHTHTQLCLRFVGRPVRELLYSLCSSYLCAAGAAVRVPCSLCRVRVVPAFAASYQPSCVRIRLRPLALARGVVWRPHTTEASSCIRLRPLPLACFALPLACSLASLPFDKMRRLCSLVTC